ncbi:MAG: GPW/gp25 family protein, partial [Candidatus Nanopelagicaceae bacterium]
MFTRSNRTSCWIWNSSGHSSSLIASHVELAIKRWEPRVIVDSVDAWPDPGGTVRIKVNYTVKSTNASEGLDVL